ncbi:hypothetical protein [Xanthocytophaga agilis]|uniref:Glycosyltransferase RgtA/B/C/D-like domain-containing protein n=1 Tax=Xanthocytophaga agilis TaxID=3048010 RepID=A0AAE3R9N5_9BACT|nr:hypothetical protein [Xanthocytophaga agilis]MDJ1503332.1 hypothetical protein [Xanthocytophaga agilis]
MKTTSGKIRIMQIIGSLLIRSGFILIIVLLLVVSCLLVSYSYSDIIQWITQTYIPTDKLDKFQHSILTPSRFVLVRYLSVMATLVLALCTYLIWKKIPPAIQLTTEWALYLYRLIQKTYYKTTSIERVCLLSLALLICICRIYFLTKLPLHVDERFTYLYFVSKGWIVSAIYYPGPNNHILFSLLCTIFNFFLQSPLWVLRLPALLSGALALFGIWVLIRHYFSAFIAIGSVSLLAFSPQVFGYSIQGRGYSLLLCWIILATGCLLSILSAKKISSITSFLFVISCFLGFYTIPIFLYPFAGLSLYLMLFFLTQKNMHQLIRLLWMEICVGILVALVYLPVTLLNGWGAVTANTWTTQLEWPTFLEGLRTTLTDLADFMWNSIPYSTWFTLIISTGSILLILTRQITGFQKHWLQLYLLTLWIIIPIMVLQRVLPYGRIMIYILPLQWPAIAILGQHVFSYFQYYRVFIIGGLIVYALSCIDTFQQLTTPEGKGIYNSLDNVSHWLYDHQADGVFVQYYEYGLCILFQYETNHRTIQLDIGADRFSTKKKYNFVVVHKDHLFPASLSMSSYQIVYKDTDATIYQYKH